MRQTTTASLCTLQHSPSDAWLLVLSVVCFPDWRAAVRCSPWQNIYVHHSSTSYLRSNRPSSPCFCFEAVPNFSLLSMSCSTRFISFAVESTFTVQTGSSNDGLFSGQHTARVSCAGRQLSISVVAVTAASSIISLFCWMPPVAAPTVGDRFAMQVVLGVFWKLKQTFVTFKSHYTPTR